MSSENVSFVDTAADRHLQHCASLPVSTASIVFVDCTHEAPAVTVKTIALYARKNKGGIKGPFFSATCISKCFGFRLNQAERKLLFKSYKTIIYSVKLD